MYVTGQVIIIENIIIYPFKGNFHEKILRISLKTTVLALFLAAVGEKDFSFSKSVPHKKV
jgi:hypothetical protein